MTNYNGKAIYQPKGRAAEYAKWACNFYVGCSNGCEYCYLKKGRGAKILGGNKPALKKCFIKDEFYAFRVFRKELEYNLPELQKHGIFFSFSTDPMLPETKRITINAAYIATKEGVPVKILTKRADWVDEFLKNISGFKFPTEYVAFGFTLTGHDELEKGASTNQERIEAMRKLHDAGFKTFASIEPIIDFESSLEMIRKTKEFCDLYKIGLMSGQKVDKSFYDRLRGFNLGVVNTLANYHAKVYWKESIRKQFDVFPDANCNVDKDYNIFNQ